MADNRIAFGLCKQHNIKLPKGATPHDAWEALKERGIVVGDDSGKSGTIVPGRGNPYFGPPPNNSSTEHSPVKNYKHKKGFIAGAQKGPPMTFEEADNGNVNPFYNSGIWGYKINCQTCVAVYFARLQGYDVRALPLDMQNMLWIADYPEQFYRDKQGNPPMYNYPKWYETPITFLNRVIKPGEIHTLDYAYAAASYGHIVIAQRDSAGSLKIYDPQSDEIYEGKRIERYLANGKTDFSTMNLTDCKINEKLADVTMRPASTRRK